MTGNFYRQKTGAFFLRALKNDRIFDRQNQNIKWVIYLNGHGVYGQTIASIHILDFDYILNFFNKKINTNLFIYNSCYAAGSNAAVIYGELTKTENVKEYSFPIIAEAVTDAPTFLYAPQYKNQQILLSCNFNAFIEQFIIDDQLSKLSSEHKKPLKNPYIKSLTYIMPYLKAYEDKEIHSQEQISFPSLSNYHEHRPIPSQSPSH